MSCPSFDRSDPRDFHQMTVDDFLKPVDPFEQFFRDLARSHTQPPAAQEGEDDAE